LAELLDPFRPYANDNSEDIGEMSKRIAIYARLSEQHGRPENDISIPDRSRSGETTAKRAAGPWVREFGRSGSKRQRRQAARSFQGDDGRSLSRSLNP